jgi:glycerol-3-phosphate acyltransferase PlsX
VPQSLPSDSIVISIDAMGGDFGPPVVAEAIGIALDRLEGRKVHFLLHGDEKLIKAELDKLPKQCAACEIRHTDLVIHSEDKPAQALRRGKGSSLWNAVASVKAGEAQGALSAGNTGALMAISKLQLRMVSKELERPAIAANWPTQRGQITVLDVGANITSDAAQLVEFAIMGEAFHRAMHGTEKPSIGLLNVGAEDEKGHDEVKEAHAILRTGMLPLNYKGFVEGTDLGKGTVDVVVTDGFTGNVALKTAEGMARFFATLMKEAMTSSLLSKVGAALVLPAMKKMRRTIDPAYVNGGPLLGLNGIVVKSHGGADARGFANAIVVVANLASSQYAGEIEQNMSRLSEALEAAERQVEAGK